MLRIDGIASGNSNVRAVNVRMMMAMPQLGTTPCTVNKNPTSTLAITAKKPKSMSSLNRVRPPPAADSTVRSFGPI